MASDWGNVSAIVAVNIRRWRKWNLWTAKDLAYECYQAGYPQITANVIAFIETGRPDPATGRRRRHVTVDELEAFADVFGIGPIQLLREGRSRGDEIDADRAKLDRIRKLLDDLRPPDKPTPCEDADEGFCHYDAKRSLAMDIQKILDGDDHA